jgi:hypothetical protein
VRATPAEARRYDITGQMLMEVACDCYHEHYMEYRNVADVLSKCYYNRTLITDEARDKKDEDCFRLIGYTPYGESNTWIVANGSDNIEQFEHGMKTELTVEWWPEHRDEYDEKEDFYNACYCKVEPVK